MQVLLNPYLQNYNSKIQTSQKINFKGLEQTPKKQGKILGMTFPKQDTNLGLEPSILTVLPDGDNVEYLLDHKVDKYPEKEVDKYLCSVYITGMEEFIEWAKKHPKEKIIAGGYEPTINPQDFLPYADRVITGPCDSFNDTMAQSGRIVKGITKNQRIPRYDLYDLKLNQQIIPDKMPNDIVTSINTSEGCPNNCDFCCSPLMVNRIMSKPTELVEEEISYLKQYEPKWIFIRDENFPLQRDWKQKLAAISKLDAKIYLFASANLLNDDTLKFMKDNNVYMTCLGLEDITTEYAKNRKLDEVCENLYKYGIYKYLSFIVDPTKVNTDEKSDAYYTKLMQRFADLCPEMVCGNFLMPFRGTKLWDKYKHLVSFDDYKEYNSKSAFLEKDPERKLVDEFNMFKYQWQYYMSELYKSIREFQTGDTLHLRFLELKEMFVNKIQAALAQNPDSEALNNLKL
ncbi:MAG: radical SAM protein [Muribaculaceae bacterium]|nr:radical SAM protein [Muribaculaceae bacterium]